MALASVNVPGRGATDRLLAKVAARLSDDGVRVVGALHPTAEDSDGSTCNCDLWLLPDGPKVRITQDLGAGSTACRMDAGAMEDAVGLATTRFVASGADIVVLNKFGLSEAEGRGFRSLIAEALGRGVPVLTGLSETHRAAFERYADGMAIALPPDEEAILAWCRTIARPGADVTEVD
ncbi:MAG: 3-dehydroquinate dehydratase [Rhodobacter sp.]|nr:3-dehydroquinate dehydratase [Rhodobacter sp.]